MALPGYAAGYPAVSGVAFLVDSVSETEKLYSVTTLGADSCF